MNSRYVTFAISVLALTVAGLALVNTSKKPEPESNTIIEKSSSDIAFSELEFVGYDPVLGDESSKDRGVGKYEYKGEIRVSGLFFHGTLGMQPYLEISPITKDAWGIKDENIMIQANDGETFDPRFHSYRQQQLRGLHLKSGEGFTDSSMLEAFGINPHDTDNCSYSGYAEVLVKDPAFAYKMECGGANCGNSAELLEVISVKITESYPCPDFS